MGSRHDVGPATRKVLKGHNRLWDAKTVCSCLIVPVKVWVQLGQLTLDIHAEGEGYNPSHAFFLVYIFLRGKPQHAEGHADTLRLSADKAITLRRVLMKNESGSCADLQDFLKPQNTASGRTADTRLRDGMKKHQPQARWWYYGRHRESRWREPGRWQGG
jgi:hypothetical protein